MNARGNIHKRGLLAAGVFGAAAIAVLLLLTVGQAGAFKAHSAGKNKGKAGAMSVATKSFDLSVNDSVRYEVYCPRGKRPFGGGEFATPAVDTRGTGVFPDS